MKFVRYLMCSLVLVMLPSLASAERYENKRGVIEHFQTYDGWDVYRPEKSDTCHMSRLFNNGITLSITPSTNSNSFELAFVDSSWESVKSNTDYDRPLLLFFNEENILVKDAKAIMAGYYMTMSSDELELFKTNEHFGLASPDGKTLYGAFSLIGISASLQAVSDCTRNAVKENRVDLFAVNSIKYTDNFPDAHLNPYHKKWRRMDGMTTKALLMLDEYVAYLIDSGKKFDRTFLIELDKKVLNVIRIEKSDAEIDRFMLYLYTKCHMFDRTNCP